MTNQIPGYKLARTLLLLSLVYIVAACSPKNTTISNKQYNSSFKPGQIWLDEDSVHINAHGGGLLFYKDTYYWFGEHKTSGRDGNSALVGVSCYSSADLYNWKNEGIALPVSDQAGSDIEKGCVIERPKVIYNEKTEKFVMWFHLELKGQGYNAARTAVAVSDHITGPYIYLRSVRPNKKQWPVDYPEELKSVDFETQQEWWTPKWREDIVNGMFLKRDFEPGQMSRDMTLFVDDNGTAYHISASEDNLTLHIAELTPDYLDFSGKWARVFPAGHNEAPALFKHDGKYYLITSGCTGWAPNDARLAVADSIWGPWKALGNPCVGEHAELTFNSQSTYIVPVQGYKNAFIFIADKWTPKNPIDGRYVWLPIAFESEKPVIKWLDEWNLSVFN